MNDPIVEEVWRVREELIKKHGGLDGYIKHIQTMDKERARKTKQRAEKMTSAPASDAAKRKPRKPRGRVPAASRK